MRGELRKAAKGYNAWTKAELQAGFAYFKEQHGRYPTSHEIDNFPYLPSARSIQRSFGGLVALRRELFPDEVDNFTKGKHRSDVAKKTFANGRDLEELFYDYLITHFEPIAVHEQKIIRPGNVRSDYFVYLNDETGIVIDVFYAESIINLVNVVNIKIKRYSLITQPTFLVSVGNPRITQEEIAKKVQNRRVPLPVHIRIVSEDFFKAKYVPQLKLRSNFTRG